MSVPLIRLPSLDQIRGFVAVGRRMSITLAARDLFLTQSAISRQIQGLEETLGVRLFVRRHRSLHFTSEGERLFRSADSAVQQLQDVVGTLSSARQHRPVTVTASTGVTGLWLLPRLARFQRAHPDIEVRVTADNRMLDLRSEGIDLAIRYCPAAQAPIGATRLFGESIAPVAAPALGLDRLGEADDLDGLFLLEFDDPARPNLQWEAWLADQGWKMDAARGVHRFNQYDQLIQAAISGQGVALGRLELIQGLLEDRRLALVGAPRRADPVDGYACWLIVGEGIPRAEVGKVAQWILDEARLAAMTT